MLTVDHVTLYPLWPTWPVGPTLCYHDPCFHSGIECKDDVFAAHQVQYADLKPLLAPAAPVPAPVSALNQSEHTPNGAIVAIINPEEKRPIPVTELIFAPRKKEMNKGYLMFSQDEGLTSEWHKNFQSLGIRCCYISCLSCDRIALLYICC